MLGTRPLLGTYDIFLGSGNDYLHKNTAVLQSLSVNLKETVPKAFYKLIADPHLRDAYYDNIPTHPWQMRVIKPQFHARYINLFKERVSTFEITENVTRNQQFFDYQHYLPNDILVKMDRASMAHSIEVRSPFLDYRLHEFANRLPIGWLLDRFIGKKFLRKFAERHLPQEVVMAKKRGFGIPVNKWTSSDSFLSKFRENMNKSRLIKEYLNHENLLSMIQNGRIKDLPGSLIWKIQMLGKWEQEYCSFVS